ncbi:MAG: hypothetical protein WD049_06625 [Candidatus Paceibacterota bacterium]
MRRLLLFVVVLAVAVGALGYWRGWFSLTKEGTVDIQVDADKFKLDKDAISKSFGEKVQATKDKIASLRKKSEGLTSDEKALTQQELNELEAKHDRLEQQIKELDDASCPACSEHPQATINRLVAAEAGEAVGGSRPASRGFY